MKLHELQPPDGAFRERKRLGRGVGSGAGKTAGRGTKGRKSRSGGNLKPGFEGGQMPIHRRLPKRGFTNIFKKKVAVVNLRDLSRFDGSEAIDEAALEAAGLVKGKRDGVKLLGKGDLDVALTVRLPFVSKGAREKIEAAGGKIEAAAPSGE